MYIPLARLYIYTIHISININILYPRILDKILVFVGAMPEKGKSMTFLQILKQNFLFLNIFQQFSQKLTPHTPSTLF